METTHTTHRTTGAASSVLIQWNAPIFDCIQSVSYRKCWIEPPRYPFRQHICSRARSPTAFMLSECFWFLLLLSTNMWYRRPRLHMRIKSRIPICWRRRKCKKKPKTNRLIAQLNLVLRRDGCITDTLTCGYWPYRTQIFFYWKVPQFFLIIFSLFSFYFSKKIYIKKRNHNTRCFVFNVTVANYSK